MSGHHASALVGSDFRAFKAGMTVIVTDTDGAWRMAEVIWVKGGAKNSKVPTMYQDADVDPDVINLVNSYLMTQIVARI